MNKVLLIGNLTNDVEGRTTDSGLVIARYTLAVNRKGKDESDFIQCVAFGKSGEFAEKYFRKGMKVAVVGHLQTGSYEKDGRKVYTTEVIIEEQEFAEKKKNDFFSDDGEPPFN